MARMTWLADELRKAGVKVVEVDGWKTRGSSAFQPLGVTWHATAGSRDSTAQGEVNVILNGSTSAPPPIAQIMLYRDGTAYICAAGRCNHNKVGWGGLNEGLGNSNLIGIEMANDNRGEPWPAAQLNAARKITAAIFRKIGADPRKRLASHAEHQPGAKTDPLGIDMAKARRDVYAIMTGTGEDDEEMSVENARAGFVMALREARHAYKNTEHFQTLPESADAGKPSKQRYRESLIVLESLLSLLDADVIPNSWGDAETNPNNTVRNAFKDAAGARAVLEREFRPVLQEMQAQVNDLHAKVSQVLDSLAGGAPECPPQP